MEHFASERFAINLFPNIIEHCTEVHVDYWHSAKIKPTTSQRID